MLGGDFARTRFAGKFWLSRRDLDIWVSDYRWNLDVNRRIFERLEKSNYSVDFADFVKCFLGGKVTDCFPLSVCFLRQSANIAVIS
ncbi:MAG: hypothetical protein IGS23_05980 [Rivularia sp. T60_A2020_040]|nr:hypothetical protein [Rivularia sp. T60_A2020_040]